MSSEVDIVNLALSNLGDSATVDSISPPDGSVQAGKAATLYPIARGQLLQRFPWSFATRRAALQAITNTAQPTSWLYSYTKPSECLLIQAIYPEDYTNDAQNRFVEYEVETLASGAEVIYCNCEAAQIKYTKLVTDTTVYPPLFVVALARLLSAMLAGPLLRGNTGTTVSVNQMKIFEQIEYPNAARADARQRNSNLRTTFVPSAATARL